MTAAPTWRKPYDSRHPVGLALMVPGTEGLGRLWLPDVVGGL